MGICRSVCRIVFGTYHGAFVIDRRTIFWNLCNTSMLELLAVPHRGMPYVHMGFMMVLYSSSLFSSDNCRVRVGKNLYDRFPVKDGLKQGDALWPLLFNFASEYAVRRVRVKQGGLTLNGTHQLLGYADDVNILGGTVHTVKGNVEALVGIC